MKKAFYVTCLILSAMLLGGCLQSRIDELVSVLAVLAPEGEDNAIDGYRTFAIKPGVKYSVYFVDMYREDNVLHASSFVAEGMLTRYSGAPFAWKIPE